MRNLAIFTLSIVFFLPQFLVSQPIFKGVPFVNHYSPEEYKAGIQNWSIAQDARGVIYIANNYGLLEFDGHDWETYRVNSGSKMRSIALAEDGKIYVGCQGDFGYFFPGVGGRLTYTSLADSLTGDLRNFDETWSVFIDRSKIYFCTFSRIYMYENGKFDVFETANPLELSFFVNNELYVLEKNKGLTKLAGDTLQLLRDGKTFARSSISSILPLSKETLLISTFRDGIFEWQESGATPWSVENQKVFKDKNVNCMLLLRSGNIAMGTQNDGLYIFNKQGLMLKHLSTGRGLRDRTVLSLYEDDLSNLWVGHNNGISYVELGSPFSLLNEQIGLPGTGYAGFVDGNKLYLGTNNGLYVTNLDDWSGEMHMIEGSNGQVYHVARHGGEILMGHHTGAYRIEGLKAIRISDEPGAWTFSILPNTEGKKMVGGIYHGLQIFEKKSGRWAYVRKLPGFSESSRVMEFSKEGDLWMTHGYKGVYKISLADKGVRNVSFYGDKKGFPSNSLINVYNIRNELLYTSEGGVYRYDASTDSFVLDPLISRLLGPTVQLWALKEDAFGNLYFIGIEKSGILKRTSVGDYVAKPDAFRRIRVFLNDDLENLHILSNNEVLFGAKEGFIHYDPTKDIERQKNFNALIRRVSLVNQLRDSVVFFGNIIEGGKVVSRSSTTPEPVEFSYSQNAIRFRYSATTYEGNDVHFQHYLENFDKAWSSWTTASQKEYTNLKEGRYVFQVRARNASGELSQPAQFIFYIHPPWYRSLWAIIAYVLLVVGALLVGYILIDQRYKRAQRLLRLKQKKELIRKENELELMTQQSQQQIERLQHEKLESELSHLNKELGSSTFHLLNKNEFISGIKVNINSIVKRENNEEVKKELMRIVHDIDANISADADWEQFQMHFDRVHGDFANRFKLVHPNLSPQEIKLSAYLRMNLSTKEIAQLLHISVRGVEISRYRLRKKLQIDRAINLQEYILGF